MISSLRKLLGLPYSKNIIFVKLYKSQVKPFYGGNSHEFEEVYGIKSLWLLSAYKMNPSTCLLQNFEEMLAINSW